VVTPEDKKSQDRNDTESRLTVIEKKYEEAHRFFKHTLSAITIIFLFVGIFIAILSISSKNEVNDAIREMERKFEILSGQALKKPEIQIFYNDEPIGGKKIDIESKSENSILLNGFYLKNIGDNVASDISINFYFSIPIGRVWTVIGEHASVTSHTILYSN
jgi:hypothetical protein